MGSYPNGFPGSMDGFDLPGSNETLGLANGFYLDEAFLDFASLDPPERYPQNNDKFARKDSLSSPSDDTDFSDSVLNYISQVLMEEDMEEKPCMFHDTLALQAAEKSLYEALGEKYPSLSSSSMDHPEKVAHDSPDGSCSGGVFSDYASTTTTTSSDSHWSVDSLDNIPSWLQTPC